MLNRIITYCFYGLFFLTPLFWTSLNYELFEYNKMILVYGFTVFITGVWILQMISQKAFTVKRTPLDIPLLLFLAANILSTIFSIDPHTSIWGYYSRSNGGLLSLVSYLLLYFAFVSNMDKQKVLNTLKFGLISGFIISLWAIFEHFGVSLSCVMLRGEFNASCWIQDVQARVFATLGQPNWLAAYLAMLIFPALYFLLTSKTRLLHTTYYILLVTLYLAFTFTYSRGPTLGLIGGLLTFLVFIKFRLSKPLILFLVSCFLVNLFFGSAITSFRLVSKFAAPARPTISLPSSGTQLENGGTESGQIRLIVWAGALDIFKAYPMFGSGVETFAYSYYQFRPISHNLTSEWDFLYNKAHNEYLNYLATTGLVGFISYMIVIFTFIVWGIKYYVSSIKQKKHNTYYLILTTSLLASYVSYLIYNFFLFSVVILAVFFYLFPALVFVVTESTKPLKLPRRIFSIFYVFAKQKGKVLRASSIITVSVVGSYLLFSILQLWYADTLFAGGQRASEGGNPGKAYNLLSVATQLNKGEPFYSSELGYSAAAASAALKATDASTSADLALESVELVNYTSQISPRNVSFWRTAVRSYFELGQMDQALKALDKVISLAPTDPKPLYNKALILDAMGKKEEEIKVLEQAIKLKPNYQEALVQLNEVN